MIEKKEIKLLNVETTSTENSFLKKSGQNHIALKPDSFLAQNILRNIQINSYIRFIKFSYLEDIKYYIDQISKIVELIGVLTIFLGILYSIAFFLIRFKKSNRLSFDKLRQYLGKSILLGLEILIAADIMATVVTDPTLQSVSVLGLIVLIRTILSFSLQIEVDGRLPWQKQTRQIPTKKIDQDKT